MRRSRLLDPTVPQLRALLQADRLQPGERWPGPREAAEECVNLGWLQAANFRGPGAPDVVYELTTAGREVHAGRSE